jgi:hypothetical protein
MATVPDYRAVIQAIARRDNVRLLLDGMASANDRGLTTSVPARIEVLVDGPLKLIRIGNQGLISRRQLPADCSGRDDRQCESFKYFTGCKTYCRDQKSADRVRR